MPAVDALCLPPPPRCLQLGQWLQRVQALPSPKPLSDKVLSAQIWHGHSRLTGALLLTWNAPALKVGTCLADVLVLMLMCRLVLMLLNNTDLENACSVFPPPAELVQALAGTLHRIDGTKGGGGVEGWWQLGHLQQHSARCFLMINILGHVCFNIPFRPTVCVTDRCLLSGAQCGYHSLMVMFHSHVDVGNKLCIWGAVRPPCMEHLYVYILVSFSLKELPLWGQRWADC
jgi:hypothetical protein